MNFVLDIPKDRICPTSFISSSGSVRYQLVALITRNKQLSWDVIAKKSLLDFKGYHNIRDIEFAPSVNFKQFFEEKITSVFTLRNPVLIIGHDTNLNATLELAGVRDYNVDVTVKLLRNSKCADNLKTETISLQRQEADCYEDTSIFEWNLDVTNVKRVTFVNELTPAFRAYTERYYVKVSFRRRRNESD